MMARTERWERDGRTALVEVADDETVVVSAELLAQMMTDLGFRRDGDDEAVRRNLAVLRHEAETPMREHGEDGECCRLAASGDGAGA